MPPPWLSWSSRLALIVAFLSAVAILVDVFVRRNRQRMWIMEVVWPVSALYFGPLAVLAYRRWGRPQGRRWRAVHGDPPDKPFFASVAVGDSHCGAGCTLGDIVGGFVVLLTGLEIGGLTLWPEYGVDYVFAFMLGIEFQYFTIAPMRGLGLRKGIGAAVKADALSLTTFEVGLFGWMAVVQLALFRVHHLGADTTTYWFMMQIGMVLGFATAYPANWWLLRRGLKEEM
jgi:hypothetical protein